MSRKKTRSSKRKLNKKQKNLLVKKQENVQGEISQTEEQEPQVTEIPTASPRVSSKLFYFAAVFILVAVAIYLGVQKYGNQIMVAKVNGQPIFKLTLWQKLEKRFGSQMIDEMVNEALIRQEAAKKNIIVSQKDIDKSVKDLEARFKGKEGLDQMLGMQGMTRDDLINQINLQLTIEKIIGGPVKVSDKEINDEYEKNQANYGEELTAAVKTQIKDQLTQQKTSKAFSDWFAKVKKSAKINKYL